MAEPVSDLSRPGAIDTLSAEFSWVRSDLSNLRTLLSWARTAVSMIGFGFTIYNFYDGVFQDTGGGVCAATKQRATWAWPSSSPARPPW